MSNPLDSRGIPPGAIKDRQVSKTAKLDPGKLKPVDPGQILVGQDTKKLAAQTVAGDATIAPDGTLTLNSAAVEGEVKKVLQNLNIEEGAQANMKPTAIKKLYEELPEVKAFTPEYNRLLKYADSDEVKGALVKRDEDGKAKLKVDDFVYPSPTTTTSNGNSTTTTSSAPKVIEFVPNTSNYPCSFSHTFGYIPDVTVFKNNSGTYEMIDAQVTATSSNVTVNVSDPSISTRIVAK